MSTIGSATDLLATGQAASAAANVNKASSSEQQDRFLMLLVTQLRNQDPLNPMDNAQITSQMAQISTVTGIDKLNASLEQMAATFSAGQSVQATSMIGRHVAVPGNTLQLVDGSGNGGVELSRAADKVLVTIRDGAGLALQQIDLGPQPEGVLAFQWDGTTASGAQAAAGNYSFTVDATQGGKAIDALALSFGLVGGVTQGKGGVTLNVVGKGSVSLADIRQVL